jgi:homoserine kinase
MALQPELPIGRATEVDVPASSANLGPGFDALGLALDWRDRYHIEVIDSGTQVDVTGGDPVPDDEHNLVLTSLRRGLHELCCQAPGLRLTGRHTIPHGRGLGSSAAAIVAGLAAAQALAAASTASSSGPVIDPEHWLPLAERVEGHPDNVAAALAGGLVLVHRGIDGAAKIARPVVHSDVAALILVPDRPVSTQQARGLLPAAVPHGQAASNSGCAALLIHALTAEPGLLYEATQDRLHQDYRAPAMPATATLLQALRSRRIPAALSGAGPAILVLGTDAELDAAEAVTAPGFRPQRVGIGTGVRVLESTATG